jgi:flagellar basal-body rod protein FlgG
MIRSLWIARTGLDAQQTQLDVISNNLANVSTNGFKRSRAVFEDLALSDPASAWRPVVAADADSGGPATGNRCSPGIYRPCSPKAICRKPTIRWISRSGRWVFFQILLPDGTTGYTRDGSFQKGQSGPDRHADGYPLAAQYHHSGQRLSMSIGTDGTVTVTQPGRQHRPRLAASSWQPSSIRPACRASARICSWKRQPAVRRPRIRREPTAPGLVNQGYVETSNVNVAEELVTMIQTQRAYELNSKVVSTSDAMLGRLTQL